MEQTEENKEPKLELNVWEVQTVFTCMKTAESILKDPRKSNYIDPDSEEHHTVKMFDDYCLKRLYNKIYGFLNLIEIKSAEDELKAHAEKLKGSSNNETGIE